MVLLSLLKGCDVFSNVWKVSVTIFLHTLSPCLNLVVLHMRDGGDWWEMGSWSAWWLGMEGEDLVAKGMVAVVIVLRLCLIEAVFCCCGYLMGLWKDQYISVLLLDSVGCAESRELCHLKSVVWEGCVWVWRALCSSWGWGFVWRICSERMCWGTKLTTLWWLCGWWVTWIDGNR